MPNTAESTAVCVICGKEFPPVRMEKFCGQPICRACLAAETFLCACCGRRIPWSERAASSGGGICQACFDERFTHCCICGRVLRHSEAHWRGRMVRSDRSAPAVWRPAREPQSARQKKGTFTQNGGLAHGTNKTERNVEGWEKRRCPMRIP